MSNTTNLTYESLKQNIQDNPQSVPYILRNIALDLEDVRADIAELNNKLGVLHVKEMALKNASKYVASILNRQLPMAAVLDGYIVVVSDTNITIERNVIF
jgi:hypothetical protein